MKDTIRGVGLWLGACFALLPVHAAAQELYADTLVSRPIAASPAVTASAPARSPLPAFEISNDLPRIATIDLTAEPTDIWERIRNGFAMPNIDSELVTEKQAFYLSRPQYLARIVERSRRYLHHIVAEIERRGLPTELALLPMVESAYNPTALSSAQASGLWQFIPSTGRNYQLKQNWWVDQRRDIVASTSAALDYLQSIYEMHGDWHLALASYNWGEGAVGRAIEKNRAKGLPTDYMNLTMPAETRNYVPKLQALKNIIAQPKLFGVALDAIPNRPYFATVERPAQMDLTLAAKLAETSIEEFKALNPAYNRPVTGGPPRLVLPVGKVERFRTNLENHDQPLVSWQTYELGRKDSLARVAQRFGITLARLKEVNGIGPNTRVSTGQTLLVPAGHAVASIDTARINPPTDTAKAAVPVAQPRSVKLSARNAKSAKPARKISKAAPRPRSATASKAKPARARVAIAPAKPKTIARR